MSKAKVDQAIRAMVRRIVDQFDPEQVILFGSRARGDALRDSDVDLLVVMPVDGCAREKAIEVRVALHDIPVPKDIEVVSCDAYRWRREVVGTLEWSAAHEGRLRWGAGDLRGQPNTVGFTVFGLRAPPIGLGRSSGANSRRFSSQLSNWPL